MGKSAKLWPVGGQMRPSFDELLNRARELKPIFREAARDTETNRRVSKRAMQLMRDAELFKMVQPAAFGGFEYGPTELARIGFELGQACGSTGWCGTLTIAFQWMMAYFPEQAQRDVWADPTNIVAASYTPSKQCEVVSDGFRIAGQWPYASNCENCQWLMVGAVIPAGNDTAPGLAWFLVPASDVTVDQDSWFTSGLQGTGSKTLRIDAPVFVPAHRMVRLSDIMAGTPPGTRIDDNIMSRFAFPTFGPTALVSPVIGMAQGALDAFVEMTRSRVRAAKPGMVVPLANSPLIQGKIGAASAAIESAFTLLIHSLETADAKLRAGQTLDTAERIAIRRNQGYAAKQSVNVVNELFSKEGASGSDLASPLQRFWRDVNAASLHISLDWEAISAMYGQQRFGLEPVGTY